MPLEYDGANDCLIWSGYCSSFFPVEDQMFRSVEGQAASDEEEEKWIGDQPSQMAEVKELLARFPCSNSGYVSVSM